MQVSGLRGVVAIAGGGYHSLALKSDGTVWAWGWNAYGQLGNGTTTNSSVPVQVSGLGNASSIASGPASFHSLVVRSDGTVWAWGTNFWGQLGNGSTTNSSIPVQVSGLTNTSSIAAGGNGYGLALQSDGTAWAWGIDGNGQFGDGSPTFEDDASPVETLF